MKIIAALCLCAAFVARAESLNSPSNTTNTASDQPSQQNPNPSDERSPQQPATQPSSTPERQAPVDRSGNAPFSGRIAAEVADAKRLGVAYDALAYGADPTGKTDSTAALQLAINTANQSPIVLPAGKYVISAPLMCYTVPGATGTRVAGCKIQGAGYEKTQLLLAPSFTVPPSINFHGVTVSVTPAAIDIQGVLNTAHYGSFQNGADVSGLEIAPEGCEAKPNPGEPSCAYPTSPPWITGGSNGISGIAVEGTWNMDIHDNYIHHMSGDGIFFPERLDIAENGDLTQSFAPHIYHNHIDGNQGWGINLSADSTGDDVDQNLVVMNWLGGIRVTALFNRIRHNSIAMNGCGEKLGGTSGRRAPCTTSPLGPGLYVGRDFGRVGGPYQDTVEDNQFDSNAATQIDVSTANNVIFRHNLFFTHTTVYLHNDTFPGAQNVPKVQVLLGEISAINSTFEYNQQRTDFQCAAGYPVPSAGCGFANAELDPEVATINFNATNARSTYVFQNFFRGNVGSGNYQPYAQGAGMVAGEPVMSASSGHSPAVQSWTLLDGGLGFLTPPTLAVVGGDSAWREPTLLKLTQNNGSLISCTVEQPGGPYNRAPITSVQDTSGAGSGGKISVSLSGSPGTYTVHECAIESPGSGYERPIAGVAPVCATQPVVAAIPSRGIGTITISGGGDYGAWTPGTTPPHVTATIQDSTGTGYSVIPIVQPVNTNRDPRTPPTVHWQVVGVTVTDRGYNFTTPTITFSAAPGQTAATGTVAISPVLSKSLRIVQPGACDAGATPWIIASLPPYPASNNELNAITESNLPVSRPAALSSELSTTVVRPAGANPMHDAALAPATKCTGPNCNSGSGNPGWGFSFTGQIANPNAGSTYYISTSSLIGPSSNKAATWPASAPFSCTLSSVQYLATVQGSRDSSANAFTLGIYDSTSNTVFADTIANVAFNGSSYPAVPQISSSDSVQKGDKLLLQVKAPASYGKQPTNIYLAGQVWCR